VTCEERGEAQVRFQVRRSRAQVESGTFHSGEHHIRMGAVFPLGCLFLGLLGAARAGVPRGNSHF
jgi:hypothetical protein